MQTGPDQYEFDSLLSEQVYQQAWGYCCRLCASREDAEDLLQEGLLRAYRSLRQLRQPEYFKPWLFTLLRRLWIARGRRGRIALADSLLIREQAATDPGGMALPLADALARLPAAQRELLALAYLDGLSAAELAVLLRIPAAAVSQRLQRARQALKRSWAACTGLDAAPEVK